MCRMRERPSSRRTESLSPERTITTLERGDGRGRREHVDDGVRLERRRRAVAGETPGRKRIATNGVSAPAARDHRPLRQVAEPRPPYSFCTILDPLAMQRFVHRVGAARTTGKGGEKGLRRLAPALEAGAVPGGERGRLVEEKELGVAIAPHLAPAALERADAGDPTPRCPAPAAQRPIAAMQPPAAIAHQPAALGDGV